MSEAATAEHGLIGAVQTASVTGRTASSLVLPPALRFAKRRGSVRSAGGAHPGCSSPTHANDLLVSAPSRWGASKDEWMEKRHAALAT